MFHRARPLKRPWRRGLFCISVVGSVVSSLMARGTPTRLHNSPKVGDLGFYATQLRVHYIEIVFGCWNKLAVCQSSVMEKSSRAYCTLPTWMSASCTPTATGISIHHILFSTCVVSPARVSDLMITLCQLETPW
jgi:hypothetical protein